LGLSIWWRDTKEFKSHQSRGNAETVIICASRSSDELDAAEAKLKAAGEALRENAKHVLPDYLRPEGSRR
jgi:hypothetical protein